MINVTLSNSTNEHMFETESLSLKTLLAVTILLIYIVSGKIFQKFNFHIMHESGLCMILGMLVSGIAYYFSPHTNFSTSLRFDDAIFLLSSSLL